MLDTNTPALPLCLGDQEGLKREIAAAHAMLRRHMVGTSSVS